MNKDLPPRTESEEALEVHDHSMSPAIKLATIASFLFFAGGQLVKGHYGRALALWGLAILVIVGGVLITFLTEPASTSRAVVVVAMVAAIFGLWLFQLWDAAFRPGEQPGTSFTGVRGHR